MATVRTGGLGNAWMPLTKVLALSLGMVSLSLWDDMLVY